MVDVVDALERGRELYSSRAWLAAYESLAVADQGTPLGAQDLELLATSAYMVGREEDYLRALERGHQAHLGSGEAMRAAQCAIWLAIQLFAAGDRPQTACPTAFSAKAPARPPDRKARPGQQPSTPQFHAPRSIRAARSLLSRRLA